MGLPEIRDSPERYNILQSAKVNTVDTPDKNRRTSSSHSGKSTGSEHMLSPEGVMTHSVEGCDSQFSDCTSESNLGGVSNPTYTLSHIGEPTQNTVTATNVVSFYPWMKLIMIKLIRLLHS